jgi:tRNA(Ile)-lysidine synthase
VSSARRDKFSGARLGALLEAEIGDPLAAAYCVAFSAGADSTALLAALVEFMGPVSAGRIRAVHIDHGLQPQSVEWAKHAAHVCRGFGVPCTIERVRVTSAAGESIEASARAVRYAALARLLAPGEYLLTAHHVDDQLETVLLQLARGAGVAGFAAMPANAAFAGGSHLRPLLAVTHAELIEYLAARGIEWLDDPMNADVRFDRTFLRTVVIPVLKRRWPAIASNATRTARHMADAQRLLDSIAERDWVRARDGDRLDLAGLAGLSHERACNLLRFWIRRVGRPLPSAQNLERLLAMMTEAAGDSTPRVNWAGADVRRYRGRLHLAASFELPGVGERSWSWQEKPRLELARGLGALRLIDGPGVAVLARDRLPQTLEIRGGGAGGSLRPGAGARRRTLRNLFQEHGVVPWVRAHIPLVFAARELIAVGDLWTEAKYQPAAGEAAVHLEWHGRPELY